MDESFETISRRVEGTTLWVTINRPDVLNALNLKVITELLAATAPSAIDKAIRTLVLASEGDKAFVAGADIAEMREMPAYQAQEFSVIGQRLTRQLEKLPIVTIARVQGYALGGGCELAMACDIIVASESAKFGQPEINLGLIPGFGGTQRMMHRLGPAGLDVLLSGRNLDAKSALAMGLVSRVVASDQLDSEIAEIVKGVNKGSPMAIAATKQCARLALQLDIDSGLHAEATAFGLQFASEEAREGLDAFCAKRRPSFAQVK